MSEETPPDGPWPDDRAIHRYELVVAGAPAVERGLRLFGSLVWGFATAGGEMNPGGGRVLVRDRTNGSIRGRRGSAHSPCSPSGRARSDSISFPGDQIVGALQRGRIEDLIHATELGLNDHLRLHVVSAANSTPHRLRIASIHAITASVSAWGRSGLSMRPSVTHRSASPTSNRKPLPP